MCRFKQIYQRSFSAFLSSDTDAFVKKEKRNFPSKEQIWAYSKCSKVRINKTGNCTLIAAKVTSYHLTGLISIHKMNIISKYFCQSNLFSMETVSNIASLKNGGLLFNDVVSNIFLRSLMGLVYLFAGTTPAFALV